MDLDMRDAAARDLDDIDQTIADVDADHEEQLLLQACEPRRDAAIDILGSADGLAVLDQLERAATELERGREPRAARGADTSDLRELLDRRARQAGDPTVRLQQIGGDREHRTIADAGAEDQREQLGVADRMRSAPPQPLARLLERWPLNELRSTEHGGAIGCHSAMRSKRRATIAPSESNEL